jgi:hypothetical protein
VSVSLDERIQARKREMTLISGRPERARTVDLGRVNCAVRKLNPFACLAFPFLVGATGTEPVTSGLQRTEVFSNAFVSHLGV